MGGASHFVGEDAYHSRLRALSSKKLTAPRRIAIGMSYFDDGDIGAQSDCNDPTFIGRPTCDGA